MKYVENAMNLAEKAAMEATRIELADMRELAEANENAYNAMFDGLKLVADADHPFALTLPQTVRANMFYRWGADGRRYVAVATGIVREDNFAEMMELWDI